MSAAEMNRRDFILTTAATAAVACAGACLFTCEEASAQAASSGTIDIGLPADFPKGMISPKFVKPDGLLIAHTDNKICAMTSRCPHKGAVVGAK